MSLNLHFELRLEERQSDRVFVSVVLAPTAVPPPSVEGVSVQMQDRSGEPLGARMVLPLSGAVAAPIVTTVEVRSRREIPSSARVVGVAWSGPDQLEASCPCDPGTQLEVHMRGRKVISPGDTDGLRSLHPEERILLARAFPWVDEAPPEDEAPTVVEDPDPETDEIVDEVAEQYDLDEEDAAFLKELLDED